MGHLLALEYSSLYIAMWHREVSQAVRGPKRNSIRRIRPKSADRPNTLNEGILRIQTQTRRKGGFVTYWLVTHVQRCVHMSIRYIGGPMQHEGRRKKSSSTKKQGLGFKRVEHTEKLKCELRAKRPGPG